MKRSMYLLLLAILGVSLFAGCSKSGSNDSAQSSGAGSSAKLAPGTVNEFGWTVPEKTIEFSYFPDKPYDPDEIKKQESMIAPFLLDQFNVKIHVLAYPTDRNQQLSLALASKTYPDVIVGLSTAEVGEWVKQGKAVELSNLSPEFKKQLGDDFVRYLQDDGSFYGLPFQWGYMPIPDYSASLPYQKWLDLGKPKMLSTDEFFNVMTDLQKEHPTNDKGERTYALSGFGWDTEDNYDLLAGIWGLKQGYKEDGQGNLTHWLNTAEGLEMAKYMNRYYLADMLDPDTFINDEAHFGEKLSNKRINGFIGPWWAPWQYGHEVWMKTDANWQDNDRFIQIGIKAPAAKAAYLSPKNALGTRTIVTDKAKDPEGIMKFLNYAITDEGERLMGWGVPNLDDDVSLWTTDGKGGWQFIEGQKQALLDETIDWSKVELNGGDLYRIVTKIAPFSDGTAYWYDQSFNNEGWRGILNDNLAGTVYDNTLQSITIPADDPLAMKEKEIQQLIYTGWANIVLSPDEATLESRFKDLQNQANAAGLHDIEKYRSGVYQDRLKSWGQQ